MDIVVELSKDLSVNLHKVKDNIKNYGILEAARILGSDSSHYDNFLLAGRLVIYNQKLNSPKKLSDYVEKMKTRMGKKFRNFILKHQDELESLINKYEHLDYEYDWFSSNTMVNSYLAKNNFKESVIETPLLLWLRCAVQFHYPNIEKVKDCIIELAEGYYTPSSPEMFNAAERKQFRQMASCFLMDIQDDTKSIADAVKNCMFISKGNGGIGINIGNIRHSNIRDVGESSGIVPLLMILNYTARMWNQNGKRKAAFTTFLPVWHLDAKQFIEVSLKTGDPNVRARDLNTCLWLNWLFMNRVQTNGKWTLFCPAKTKELNQLSGVEFARKYIEYEKDETITYREEVSAVELWRHAQSSQVGSGMPYMMQGDACHFKSNHKHLGKLRMSNLCLEVIEYADKDNIPSCNLHSISMIKFVKKKIQNKNFKLSELDTIDELKNAMDFSKLAYIVKKVVINLNNIIDDNTAPLDEIIKGEVIDGVKQPDTKIKGIISKTNARQLPLAIGVTGFAEMCHSLDIPVETNYVKMVNKMFFGCIYFNAVAQSIQLSILNGPCEVFSGSPMSEGKLQFDLWADEFKLLSENEDLFGKVKHRKFEDDIPLDAIVWGQENIELLNEKGEVIDVILPSWEDLKRCMVKYGMRNSLLTALMPTASSSQVRRACESFEIHQTNLYSRKVLNSNSTVMNRFMVYDLDEIKAWNNHTIDYLTVTQGSLQKFTSYVKDNNKLYPDVNDFDRLEYLEKKYKTMWEISQKFMIDLNAARSRYIDQSTSFNLYIEDADSKKIEAALLYGNAVGLKTLVYYLRQKGAEIGNIVADASLKKKIDNAKSAPQGWTCTDGMCCSS